MDEPANDIVTLYGPGDGSPQDGSMQFCHIWWCEPAYVSYIMASALAEAGGGDWTMYLQPPCNEEEPHDSRCRYRLLEIPIEED